jgi:AcrR family transcriptional regulator
MATKEKTLEPQQARSRESLRKLVKAATEVLGQHGVEGATIPRIAEHAGLTPGAIYRRFRDKDSLLEAVVLGILERQEKNLRLSLPAEMAAKIPFPVLAEQLIGSMVLSYRSQAGLLRAIRQFVQGKENTAFWKKATKLELRNFEYLVDLLAKKRGEISHPDPRVATALGLRMVSCTLMEVVLNSCDAKAWKGLMPKDDQALKHELVRSFLNYVEVEQMGTLTEGDFVAPRISDLPATTFRV